MDAVAATHHRGEFVRAGLLGRGGADFVDAFDQEIAGRGHLHRERGVEDVGGGQALVHPARSGTDGGSHIFKECDDIVVGAFFDLEDFSDGKLRLFADGLGVGRRDLSETGHRLASEGLDFEPDFVFALVGPKSAHLRPGVTVDHRKTLSDRPRATNP